MLTPGTQSMELGFHESPSPSFPKDRKDLRHL